MIRPRTFGGVLFAIVFIACEPIAFAQISVALANPAAVRAGVIAIPLRQQSPNDVWPSHLVLKPKDGGPSFDGVIAWIGAKPAPTERTWTQSQEQLDIRPIEMAPQNQSPQESGSVVLLAKTPRDIHGALVVGTSTVEPVWFDVAEIEPDPAKLPLKLGDTYALPDPVAPAEWFRWWLLADAADRKPPAAAGDEVQQLFAMYRAQLWQAGIERIERQSPGVAAEIRERLTAVSVESNAGHPAMRKACWIADADSLSQLLSILISTDRSDEKCMETALSFIRSISPVTMWPESDDGRALHFAACNSSPEEIVIQFSWLEAPNLPPLAMRLPPNGIARITVDRPAELMPDPLSGEPSPIVGTLLMTWPNNATRMQVAPAQSIIRPPGYSLGLFLPTLSLADAQVGKIQPLPLTWSTTASVRRKFGHWEIFAECLRAEVRIEDQLEVTLGDSVRTMARIQVGEAGVRKVNSSSGSGAPEVRTDSFADRWRCVIEVPEEWLPMEGKGRPFVIGVSRFTSGPSSRQTAIAAAPPWQVGPPLIQLEAAKWIDPPIQRVNASP